MANKTTKTAAEYETLLNKGITAVKSAKARITELEGELSTANTAAETRNAQIKAAKALGPEIVDRLIKVGQLNKSKREEAIEAMANPVKVAQELGNILAIKLDIPAVGTPEGEDGTKAASASVNPMQEVDDRYRERVGLR